jgi:hypothetical protein
MRKIKNNENSRLIYKEIVEEIQTIDEFGIPLTIRKTQEKIADEPINLGSVKKPNKKILSIRYEVPEEETFIDKLLKRK